MDAQLPRHGKSAVLPKTTSICGSMIVISLWQGGSDLGCPQISLRSETEAKHSETFFREIAKLTPQFRLFRFEAKKEF